MEKIANNPYAYIHGANYIPSYALCLNDVMDHYNEEIIARELGWAHEVGFNSVRMWFSDTSYIRQPGTFLSQMEQILNILSAYDMTLMPTLFNRWVDPRFYFGQLDLTVAIGEVYDTKRKYIRDVVSAFGRDPRILMWDLCNEPFSYGWIYNTDDALLQQLYPREVRFWKQCIEVFRDAAPSQPLTMGFMDPTDANIDEVCRLCDVISCHTYLGWTDDTMQPRVEANIRYSNRLKKPLINTETCQGSLDDATRAICIERTLDVMRQAELGFYVWQLCSGEMVSARRDRTDPNCAPGDSAYMSFLQWNGKLRPKHEVVKKYLQ